MTKVSDYERGRFDVLSEIFAAAAKGQNINDKMDNLLAKCISIVKKMNNINAKGDP